MTIHTPPYCCSVPTILPQCTTLEFYFSYMQPAVHCGPAKGKNRQHGLNCLKSAVHTLILPSQQKSVYQSIAGEILTHLREHFSSSKTDRVREIHQESTKIRIEIYQYINQIVYSYSESLNTSEKSPLKPYKSKCLSTSSFWPYNLAHCAVQCKLTLPLIILRQSS